MESTCMTAASAHAPVANISPDQRHDAIIAILATGLARLVEDLAAGPQELSESGQNGLEVSHKTRLSGPGGLPLERCEKG